MKANGADRIVRELVRFVREQRQINKNQQEMNSRVERFMLHSEQRFKTFYKQMMHIQHKAG